MDPKRVALEALTRQVIVFTHNALFASELERAIDELSGKYTVRSIEKSASPGVVRESLPFDTMKTGQRIDFLEKRTPPVKLSLNIMKMITSPKQKVFTRIEGEPGKEL
ncbi:hypothetical protein LCH21_04675 [Patescibacteria group bacterium]|nr:hypothetical protein [Patescibacteria group bacterium]